MARRYRIFDVFSNRPFAGNPLAIVLDSDGLDADAMQAIAREFNLSETVFVFRPQNPSHSATIRIFTPARELPFAGHPTVGTAVCLNLERFGGPGTDALVVLEEQIGIVRCGVTYPDSVGFAEFDCPRLPERAGEPPEKEFIAAALSLAPAEIGFENHVPTLWSAGVPFHFVPVQNLAVIDKAAPYLPGWNAAFGSGSAFLYTRETQGYDHSFHARLFAPEMGIAEDPATGSAVAALAGAVHQFDALPDGEHAAVVEQGFEMGRPSLIRLEMTVSGGQITLVRIGGHAVPLMSGTLEV